MNRYAVVDGTTWPVDLDDVEWRLRYGDPLSERMFTASIVGAYAHLTDPSISQAAAIRSLKRARAALAQTRTT